MSAISIGTIHRSGVQGGASPEAIRAYYDYTLPLYRLFWHGETGALHYGFCDETTRTVRDELLNTNRFLATVAGVAARSRVLDAGCGVGGSAIWLAHRFGATAVGITLSVRQAERARAVATEQGVADRAIFAVRDYLDTGYPDASFDIVWALESVCYADDKSAFLREAFRVLRPGGRLVVGDGFLRRAPRDAGEVGDLRTFLHGLVLPGLTTVTGFVDAMAAAGFRDVRAWDKTAEALPSARRLRARCRLAYPVARLAQRLGMVPALLTDNVRAGIVQLRMIMRGLAAYAVVCGERPSR